MSKNLYKVFPTFIQNFLISIKDGKSIDTYRYWKVLISIDTFSGIDISISIPIIAYFFCNSPEGFPKADTKVVQVNN